MLPTGQQLVGNDAACPHIDLLGVTLARDLLRCHVNRGSSPLVMTQPPVLFRAESEVHYLDILAIIARVN